MYEGYGIRQCILKVEIHIESQRRISSFLSEGEMSETAMASCTANWYEFEMLKKSGIQPQTARTFAQFRFTR